MEITSFIIFPTILAFLSYWFLPKNRYIVMSFCCILVAILIYGVITNPYINEGDTGHYISQLTSEFMGFSGKLTQIGFNLLSAFFYLFDKNFVNVVIMNGVFIVILGSYASWKLDKTGLLFRLILIPYIFDSAVNTIKNGLGVFTFLLLLALLSKEKEKRSLKNKLIFFILSVIALSFHSSLILLIILWLAYESSSNIKSMATILVFFTILGIFWGMDFFLMKLTAYTSGFTSPTIFSGLSFLINSLLLIFTYYSNLFLKKRIAIPYHGLLLQIFVFILARYTYAGLRFALLFDSFYLFYTFYLIKRDRIKLSNVTVLFFTSIGVFKFIFYLKNHLIF